MGGDRSISRGLGRRAIWGNGPIEADGDGEISATDLLDIVRVQASMGYCPVPIDFVKELRSEIEDLDQQHQQERLELRNVGG